MPHSTPRRSHRDRRRLGERGATLVELSLVILLFLTFVFAIIEFSWAAAQNNQIRHVAGEGARTAAVGGNVSEAICGNLSIVSAATYSFAAGQTLPDGEVMQVLTVSTPFNSLTGLIPEGGTVTAEHSFYVEPLERGLPTGGTCS